MSLHDELMQEKRVLAVLKALGEADEELLWACRAKRYGADRKFSRVFVGLSHRAIYMFTSDNGRQYLQFKDSLQLSMVKAISISRDSLQLALRCSPESHNKVLRFTKKNPSGKQACGVLLEEVQRILEDMLEETVEVTHESMADLRYFCSCSLHEEQAREKEMRALVEDEQPMAQQQQQQQQQQQRGGKAEKSTDDDRGDKHAARVHFSSSTKLDRGAEKGTRSLTDVFQSSQAGGGSSKEGGEVVKERVNAMLSETLSDIEELSRSITMVENSSNASSQKEKNFRRAATSGFDAQDFAAESMMKAFRGERDFVSIPELNKYRQNVAHEMRFVVHKNFDQFIHASSAVSAMQQDLTVLRLLASESLSCLSQINELPRGSEVSPPLHSSSSEGQQRQGRAGAVDLREEELGKEVAEALENVDMFIIERKFDKAVEWLQSCVKKEREGREEEEGSASTREGWRLKRCLEQRMKRIVDGIWKQVETPGFQMMEIERAVGLLMKLEQRENAQDLFLSWKTGVIVEAIEAIGTNRTDVRLYVAQLCNAVFSCMVQTCSEFQKILSSSSSSPSSSTPVSPDPSPTPPSPSPSSALPPSSLFSWCNDTFVLFCIAFVKEVFILTDIAEIGECVDLVKQYCHELQKSGITMENQFSRSISSSMWRVVDSNLQEIVSNVKEQISVESWARFSYSLDDLRSSSRKVGGGGKIVEEDGGDGGALRLTGSVFSLTKQVVKLILTMKKSLGTSFSGSLRKDFEQRVCSIASWYATTIASKARGVEDDREKLLNIIGNVFYLSTSLLPFLLLHISNRSNGSAAKAADLHGKLRNFQRVECCLEIRQIYENMCKTFVEKQMKVLKERDLVALNPSQLTDVICTYPRRALLGRT
ncbi:hypothetical protein GUITHDRAFT_119946 [Guillardia theta CCMP2712]|uniref:Exocyst component Exo84 C-terminal domain-containing protein n=2 Tax=Guillardia theta TaxID=55529 RepID=L1ICP1_GUITC|nr:hypothetical protein GUITHDRAFT_119946 [Guillardia theta CCMP2712]EKX33837.1 hypothetical protein GUITHDRAFT_119946 [Guillardia theta CCMP2712]|eukprot:XP_005820817.1 hypothetical protein GUITHDRAFT_119946 [Guillardia theta CCMP2712]